MVWKKITKAAGQAAGSAVGGTIAGPIGNIAGYQTGGAFGEKGLPGLNEKLSSYGKGNIYGKTQKTFGDQTPMPVLSDYQGIETLANKGQLTARQVSGADIQAQMEQSPWYKMALEKQGLEQARLMNQAAQQQAGALAGARSQLAMRGGLRGGAAERLAQSGAENLATGLQQQRMAGGIERGQLGMQGADLASRMAQFNVGQQSEAEKINLQTQLANLAAQEQRKLFQYGEGMKTKGAAMTAQAAQNAGKK